MVSNTGAGLPLRGAAQKTLSGFFSVYPVERCKVLLWNWLRLTYSGGFQKVASVDEERFIHFFDALNELLPAAAEILTATETEDPRHA